MIKYEHDLAARVNGNNLQPLAGAEVRVIDKATSLPAALYQDDELTPIPQPLVTTNTGYFGFKAADGKYDLTFSATQNSPRFDTFKREIVLEDPADNPFMTVQELALPSGAAKVGYGTDTVAGSLDALQMADYTALRAYSGARKNVYVTDLAAAGMFVRDDADTAVLGTPVNAAFSLTSGSLAAATYSYRVSAIDAYGETLASTATTLAVPAKLATPVNAALATAITGGTLAGGTYHYRVSAINAIGETLASTSTSITTANLAAPTANAPTTATTGGTLAAATYFYKVTALGAVGETIGSNEVSIATTGTASTVTVTWGAVTGATGYRVYRGTAAGGQNAYYAPGNVTTFTDTGAASTAGSVPTANTATTNTNTVTVNWGAVTGATGYKIYGRTSGGHLFMASLGEVTTWADTGSVTPAGALPADNTTSGGVTLAWGAVTNATGYKVYGRTAGAELFMAKLGAVTTYTDTGSITPAGALPTGYKKDNGSTVIQSANGKRWKRDSSIQLAASDGATKIGYGSETVSDALKKSAVAAGPRDALQYVSNISVKVFRNFATMGGFRFRGHYTKGHAPTFAMPSDKRASLDTQLGAGMTAATFENWYAVFACANNGDATASIKIMPFLRAGTVSGATVPLIKAGENVHALTAASYAWGATNNLTGTDCLVISEAGDYSGRVTTITANSASSITVQSAGSLAAYDFLLPAPPGFDHYVYLGSFYFDTAEVRNIYDSGALVKAKMIYLRSPDMATGAHSGNTSKTMNCAGYISPLATAVILDSSATLSTAATGDIAEYFDPDGSAHVVQTCYQYKMSGTSESYVFDNVQIPFLYHQKFNYSNAGALAASRINGQLNITGWIEP